MAYGTVLFDPDSGIIGFILNKRLGKEFSQDSEGNTLGILANQRTAGHNIDSIDRDVLRPIIQELGEGDIVGIKRLHISWTGRSYVLFLRPGSSFNRELIFLKTFPNNKRKYCSVEIKNLQYATKVCEELKDPFVHVPKVIVEDPGLGFVVTEWISGQDLAQLVRSSTRLWKLTGSLSFFEETTALFKWLKGFSKYKEQNNSELELVADNENWDQWLSWLVHSNNLGGAWRFEVVKSIELIIAKYEEFNLQLSPCHGDFTHWNIRLDEQGGLWVLDWSFLELGHWLASAYRFVVGLQISGNSPFAWSPRYQAYIEFIESLIMLMEPNVTFHQYFRVRAIMRYFYHQCRLPAKNLREKALKGYWKGFWRHELINITQRIGCSTNVTSSSRGLRT